MYQTMVVDGGASGSRYALYNEGGDIASVAESGPASLSLGEEGAWQNIKSGIAQIASEQNESVGWLPDKLVMGLAGSLQQQRRQNFLNLLPAGLDRQLVTDGFAQLLGATGGGAGVCLSIGTGTVVHVLDNSDRTYLRGGWGFPVGDDGSGAWLGMRVLNDYCWFRDGKSFTDDAKQFFDTLESTVGVTATAVQSWTTCQSSTRIATLARLIVRGAADDNSYALDLLEEGARLCSDLLKLGTDELPIYIVGGLAAAYLPVLELEYGDRVCQARGDALSGLYLLSNTKPDYEFVDVYSAK